MKICGFEIKKIKRKDLPEKVKGGFTLDPDVTKKGREYLFGLKGTPFSTKKNQGYLHYDGIRIANNRVYFMWKGDAIISQPILGPHTGDPLDICELIGKVKASLK